MDSLHAEVHGTDGLQQVLAYHALQDIPLGAGRQCTLRQHITLVGGEHDDASGKKLRANGDERLDPIHLRHLDIEQHDIGTKRAILRQRFASVRGLSHDAQIPFVGDERDQACAKYRMVIHRNDADECLVTEHQEASSTQLLRVAEWP